MLDGTMRVSLADDRPTVNLRRDALLAPGWTAVTRMGTRHPAPATTGRG